MSQSSTLKLDNKYRPVFSSEEIIGLVSFLESNIQQTHSLGLQPTLAKLQNLKFKIQAQISRPAYVTTGISPGSPKGELGIGPDGELEVLPSSVQMQREAAKLAAEQHLRRTTQGSFAANEASTSFEIDSIILAGVIKGYKSCIQAVDKHFELDPDSLSASKLWKQLDLNSEDMKHLFSVDHLIWIQSRR